MTPPATTDLQLRSRIPDAANGSTLLDYLLRRFRYLDRAQWLDEIAAGRLSIDGRVQTADARLRGGAHLTYRRQHAEPAVDGDIEVQHDDDHVVVVLKPAHLPMHADGPFVRNTLIHILQSRLAAPDLHLVHRLDRETSGLCVLARGATARDHLRRQFVDGAVGKTYLAVVRGLAEADFTVERPIGHCRRSSIGLRRSADDDASDPKAACTAFEVLRRGSRNSLLRCTPTTGRTHQIRVHLEAAGLPLLGDKLYGRPDADYLAFVARVKGGAPAWQTDDGGPGRQLLHAAELMFAHPGDGRRLTFTAPMPTEFEPWLA